MGLITQKKIFLKEPYFSICRYVEATLAKHGFEAWLVGGSVRDLLIEGHLSDLDYTTNATPDEVQKIFPRTVPVGIQFGTVLVLYKGQKVEVTTYRADADYEDGRRPTSVAFAKDLATDIKRRDFTINGLAYNVERAELADHCEGLHDLEKKILRTIGNPVARFQEDGLRPIRGCRIAAKLGFTIEEKTLEAMQLCVDVTKKVAPERFYDEWRKTRRMANRRAYWTNLVEAKILPAFLPHIAEAFEGDERMRLLREIDSFNPRNMAEYAGAIFHLLRIVDKEPIEKTLATTKFPTAEAKLCRSLLESPFFRLGDKPARQDFKETLAAIPALYRFSHTRFFLAMRIADMHSRDVGAAEVSDFRTCIVAHYRSIYRYHEVIDIAQLAVGGDDLKALGFFGRRIGEVLSDLLRTVMREPGANTRERLLDVARGLKD